MAEELGQLVPTGGGDPIPLLKPKLTIGRRGGCDIALKFPNVSTRHCELAFENGYWHIRDLGSTNGIKVNGARCSDKFVLPSDRITIAKHHYTIEYDADPSAAPPVEEEDIFSKSLMEKAGLSRPDTSRRPQRPSPSREPKPEARENRRPNSRPASGGNSDDDLAMDFLSD